MTWLISFQQAFYYVCGPLAVFVWSTMLTAGVAIAVYFTVVTALN